MLNLENWIGQNRINAYTLEDKRESTDPHIVEGLKTMLDKDNRLAKKLRMAMINSKKATVTTWN